MRCSTPTNFPGAANADLNNARALYALLTGRITAINSNARLDGATGQYVYLGVGRTREHQDEIGLFVQDSWRLRQNLTLNAGLRWQIAFPFQADDSVYSRNTMADLCGISGPGDGPGGRECNLFNPGVFNPGGRAPVYELYTAGSPGYETEYDNFAPNVGVAWQPNVSEGWLRTLLGDPSQATIRASYGVSYNSDGLGFYRDVYAGNPGNQITTNRTTTSAQFPLVPAGESWPVLLARAGAPWAVTRDSGRAQLPDGDRLQQRRESLSSEFQDAVRPVVFGRLPADDQPADGHRSAVRRHAARRRHGDRELERGELDDERIPRRVQAGAGQPAGQPGLGRCRARELLRLLRTGHRDVPAADLPRELQRPAAEPVR